MANLVPSRVLLQEFSSYLRKKILAEMPKRFQLRSDTPLFHHLTHTFEEEPFCKITDNLRRHHWFKDRPSLQYSSSKFESIMVRNAIEFQRETLRAANMQLDTTKAEPGATSQNSPGGEEGDTSLTAQLQDTLTQFTSQLKSAGSPLDLSTKQKGVQQDIELARLDVQFSPKELREQQVAQQLYTTMLQSCRLALQN